MAVMCAQNMHRDGSRFGWHQPHPNQFALNTSLVEIQRHYVKLQSLVESLTVTVSLLKHGE